jgi:hypothetical protein
MHWHSTNLPLRRSQSLEVWLWLFLLENTKFRQKPKKGRVSNTSPTTICRLSKGYFELLSSLLNADLHKRPFIEEVIERATVLSNSTAHDVVLQIS